MGTFGFASALLKVTAWNRLYECIPGKWRYWRGPNRIGTIIACLPKELLKGRGWKLPDNPALIWPGAKLALLWQRFYRELQDQEITILGLDPGSQFVPPLVLRNQPAFPGISDGKALELLLFINRFRSILRNYEIPPQKAKAMVVWEEGNLGITCARLVAREVRFLALLCPNERSLERTAELVLAETGISPQIYTIPPPDFRGARIVIKCGNLVKLQLTRSSKRIIWCELFQSRPSLTSMNVGLPLSVRSKAGELPLYPALGEAVLRSCFDLNYGFWFGSELPLERVMKLAACFRELGREIAV